MSTARQRLVRMGAPVLLVLFIALVFSIGIFLVVATIVAAHRGQTDWVLCWGFLLVASTTSTSVNRGGS